MLCYTISQPPRGGRRMEFRGKDIPEEKTSRTEWTRADTAQGRIGGNGTNRLFILLFFRWKPTALFYAMKLGVWRYFLHITSPRHSCTLSCLVKKVYFYFLARHIAKEIMEIMEKWKNGNSCKLFLFFFLQTFSSKV